MVKKNRKTKVYIFVYDVRFEILPIFDVLNIEHRRFCPFIEAKLPVKINTRVNGGQRIQI